MTKVQLILKNREVFTYEADDNESDIAWTADSVRQILEGGGTFVVEARQSHSGGGLAPDIGTRMAARRKALGWTQPELATRLKRSQSWVSQVERGKRDIDRVSVLDEVAKVLQMDLTEDGEPSPEPRKMIVVPASAVLYVTIT
jgi:ribosome-binding protein aMBF1 (putative translation factor)